MVSGIAEMRKACWEEYLGQSTAGKRALINSHNAFLDGDVSKPRTIKKGFRLNRRGGLGQNHRRKISALTEGLPADDGDGFVLDGVRDLHYGG